MILKIIVAGSLLGLLVGCGTVLMKYQRPGESVEVQFSQENCTTNAP